MLQNLFDCSVENYIFGFGMETEHDIRIYAKVEIIIRIDTSLKDRRH